MYSRVTLVEIDLVRSSLEEALDLFKQNVVPGLREQEGFEGTVVMATPEGKGLIVTLWETPEAAESQAETGFYSDVLAEFVTLFRAPPGRESYEVLYADVPTVSVT